jgi:hypothetical protein
LACSLGTCAAAGWMTHAAVTSRPPQVFELDPGMGSGSIWQEVSLLRRCNHKRIVPLLGVAIKVRRRRFPCSAGLKGGLCAAAMACLFACLPACRLRGAPQNHVMPAGGMAGPSCAAVLHAGSVAASS